MRASSCVIGAFSHLLMVGWQVRHPIPAVSRAPGESRDCRGACRDHHRTFSLRQKQHTPIRDQPTAVKRGCEFLAPCLCAGGRSRSPLQKHAHILALNTTLVVRQGNRPYKASPAGLIQPSIFWLMIPRHMSPLGIARPISYSMMPLASSASVYDSATFFQRSPQIPGTLLTSSDRAIHMLHVLYFAA